MGPARNAAQSVSDRDLLLGEKIIWQGSPRVIQAEAIFKVAAGAWAALSVTATCFAIVVSLVLQVSPTQLLLLAIWCATFALLSVKLPRIWQEKVRYIVTERHVVCERGKYRRTIERRSISFARIMWNPAHPGIGDIELVRAVPTGVLRRKLLLKLTGVSAPDGVWDIIRGVTVLAAPSSGERPLAQRLDPGERVIWSARPHPQRFTLLPQGRRGWGSFAISLLLSWVVIAIASRMFGGMVVLKNAGLADTPVAYAALVAAELITVGFIAALAIYLLYSAVLLPFLQLDSTSYLITNTRVLIQRGHEELHLDRTKIVDLVHLPALKGARDIFLVLDGPRARALAMSGAFGEVERGLQLRPVLESVDDVDGASQALFAAQRKQRQREASIPPAAA